MADPISSLGSNDSLDCHIDDGSQQSGAAPAAPPKATEPLASLPVPTASSASSAGTQTLVARFSPSPPLPKPAAASALPVISRTTLSTSSGLVPGGGSYRVSATGLKVQVESGALQGSALEVGTASIQVGQDTEIQATALRRTSALSGHGYGVSVTGDVAAVRGYIGEKNDDGSIGGNIGAGAELIGAEIAIDTPVASLTYGQSVSLGAGGSMGVRDKDHDGKPEYCAKFSIPAYTVGACVEQFW